jgi:hypothetical protein
MMITQTGAPTMNATTHRLIDADSDSIIQDHATPNQIAASDAAGPEGIILIDPDGDVIDESARTATSRRVYTEPVG